MNGEIFNMDPEKLAKEMTQKGLQIVMLKGIQSICVRLDCIEKKLLDPDSGIYSRVASNRRWVKIMIWLMGLMITLLAISISIQII